jgi:hypothetical protein
VQCLFVDLGIVEDADLDLEPERCSGGFGLALSPHSDTEHEADIAELDLCNSLLRL